MATIKHKRGTRAALDASPGLQQGELGLCTDTGELFIGNNGNHPILEQVAAKTLMGNTGSDKALPSAIPAADILEMIGGAAEDHNHDGVYQEKIALSGILKGNGSNVQVAQQGTDYAAPSTKVSVTLPAASWADNAQTVNVTGATATNIKVISPDPASVDEYAACGVKAAAEGEGTITFACAAAPENDLTVNIVIVG